MALPGGSAVENPLAVQKDTGDTGSIHGLGRSPEGGNDKTLQYSCMGNPMDSPQVCKTIRHNLVTKQQQHDIKKNES